MKPVIGLQCGLALLGGLGLSAAQAKTVAVVKGSDLNVRAQASLQSEVVVQLQKGETVTVLEEIPGTKPGEPSRWAKIVLPSRAPAYVHADYIRGDAVVPKRLNVRFGPGENYSVLTRLEQGTRIKPLRREGEWLVIEPPTQAVAYVAAEFLQPQTPPSPSVLPGPVLVEKTAIVIGTPPPPALALPLPERKTVVATPLATPPDNTRLASLSATDSLPRPLPATPPAIKPVPKSEPMILAPLTPQAMAATTTAVVEPAPPTPAVTVAAVAPRLTSPKQSDSLLSLPPSAETESSRASAGPSTPPKALSIPEPEQPQLNRFGLAYRMRFNVGLTVKERNGASLASAGSPAGHGETRIYDDGYNRVDSSGNAGGLTWNWGYDNASQLPGNDTVEMHRSSWDTEHLARNDEDADVSQGLEFSYSRELGQFWRMHWGVEGAFNYSPLTLRDRQHGTGNLMRFSDAFSLNGIVPPLSPYHGSFEGPGAIISDQPQRTLDVIPNGATITSQHELDADIFGVRVGPWIEKPLSDRVTIGLGGGFSLAYAQSDYKFTEQVQLLGLGARVRHERDSVEAWLVGGYLAGSVSVKLTRSLSAFAGMQYEMMEGIMHRTQNSRVELDLSQNISLTLGVGYSF